MVAEAGEILAASPAAAPPGTKVEVAELFFKPRPAEILEESGGRTGPDPELAAPPGPGLPPDPLFPVPPGPDHADGPGGGFSGGNGWRRSGARNLRLICSPCPFPRGPGR